MIVTGHILGSSLGGAWRQTDHKLMGVMACPAGLGTASSSQLHVQQGRPTLKSLTLADSSHPLHWPCGLRWLVSPQAWRSTDGTGKVAELRASFLVHSLEFNHQCHDTCVWWHTPAAPTLEKWRQGDQKFKVSLGYLVSLRLAWTTWEPVRKSEVEGEGS